VSEADPERSATLVEFLNPGSAPADGGVPPAQRQRPYVGFDRRELHTILTLYGRKVVAGEWRDYAMDFLKDRALFSVYKRASEKPVYVIEKNPKLRARQGQYMVTGQDGRVLKRGHELDIVLRVLELAVVR
jgi:hypothetical protein